MKYKFRRKSKMYYKNISPHQGARERSEGKYRRSLRIDRAIYTLKWAFGFFDLLYLLMDYLKYIYIFSLIKSYFNVFLKSKNFIRKEYLNVKILDIQNFLRSFTIPKFSSLFSSDNFRSSKSHIRPL